MIYLFRFEFRFISQVITDRSPPVTGVHWWVGGWVFGGRKVFWKS